jgi:hypothetical protein
VPIKESTLLAVLQRLSDIGFDLATPPRNLDALFRSKAVRVSSVGLAPHPVLRNLYRTRLRVATPGFLRACHRLLANHYYDGLQPRLDC